VFGHIIHAHTSNTKAHEKIIRRLQYFTYQFQIGGKNTIKETTETIIVKNVSSFQRIFVEKLLRLMGGGGENLVTLSLSNGSRFLSVLRQAYRHCVSAGRLRMTKTSAGLPSLRFGR
jgi:hypothetical protein